MESKSDDLISTNDPLNTIQFSDIFNLNDIQHLQDLFADANGVASIITRVDGSPITNPSNFSRLCSDIIRKTEKGCINCFKSDASLFRQSASGVVIRKCLSAGLWEAGGRIIIGGRHIANWIIGQVRNEKLDMEHMITYADEIGVDREVFLEALNEVPVMSVEQLGKLTKMLFLVANEYSERAYNNWQLKTLIADREKAKALLEESENRFKVLFNIAPFRYQALDFDGRFIEVNQLWMDTLGYSQEEVIGKWFGDFLSPASQEDFRKIFQIFKAKGRIHCEFEMIHKNGNLLFIAFDGTIGYDLNGEFKQTHCILQDITDYKQLENVLRQSDTRLKLALDSGQAGVWHLNLLDFTSERSLRHDQIFGYNTLLPYWSYKTFLEHVLPEDVAEVDQKFLNAIDTQSEWNVDCRILRNDGEVRWISTIGRHILDSKGKSVQMSGIVQDITDRKKAELALQESELKYRMLIENSPDAIAIYVEGNLVFVNKECLNLMAASSPEELIGKSVIELVHPDSREIVIQRMKEVEKEGVVLPLVEEKFVRLDGSTLDVEVKAMSILWNDKPAVQLIVRNITERKRAEEIIRESEKNLQEAQHLAHIGSWTWTVATDKVKLSKELYHIFGRDPNSPLPFFSKLSPYFTAESWKRRSRAIEKSLQTGEQYELELEIVRPDGTKRHTLSRGEVDFNASGRIEGMHGTIQDITERKQAQDALHAIEEKLHDTYLYLRSLIETSLDPLVTIDAEGKITDVNTATEKATGLSRNALIRTDFADYFTEPDKARTGYHKAFNQGYVVDYPLTIRHTSGKLTDVLYNASVYHDKQGKILGIFAAARDITSRKQAEEALRKSETRLKEAQHIAMIGNWEHNLDLNEMTWSDEMYHIFEVDQSKSEALFNDFLSAIHPDDWVRINKAREAFRINKKPSQLDYRLLMPDGRVKYVHECFETYYAIDGNPQRTVGTVQDITLRKQSDLLLHEKNEELIKLNEDKDQFMSILAHDLKSPFNSILGFLEILSSNIREYDLDTIESQINIVETSAKRVFFLLEDLLLWSRSQSGQLAYEPQKLNLTSICQDILSDLKLIADSKNITIIDSVPNELAVFADKDMLKTVLRNLISNAIKYSNPEGQIVINANQEDPKTTISVSDTGVGMKSEIAGKLFEISHIRSTKGTANETRTGLGLLLCKEFVAKHGGRIWVESEVGKGSTFYFSIASNQESKEQITGRNPLATEKVDIHTKKLNILIADDDEASKLLLATTMMDYGKEVFKAKTGIEAVETCRKSPDIDLVLMDIKMPEMDGYEATRRIRQFNRKVIIIAQTAFGYTESRKEALEAGCNDYLQKPFKQKKLIEMVEKYF